MEVKKRFENITVYQPSYTHNQKIFIVAWIMYIKRLSLYIGLP